MTTNKDKIYVVMCISKDIEYHDMIIGVYDSKQKATDGLNENVRMFISHTSPDMAGRIIRTETGYRDTQNILVWDICELEGPNKTRDIWQESEDRCMAEEEE